MSQPTREELRTLKVFEERNDSEAYHDAFDELLEAKLMALDPEWMTAMQQVYEKSEMSRWCA